MNTSTHQYRFTGWEAANVGPLLSLTTSVTAKYMLIHRPASPSPASAIVATQAQLQSFQYVAQYAAAAYCNSADSLTAGTLVSCSNDACPDLETNRVFLEGILEYVGHITV